MPRWRGFDYVDFQFLVNQAAKPSGNPCHKDRDKHSIYF